MSRVQRLFRHAAAGFVLAAVVAVAPPLAARATPDALPEITLTELPAQGRETLALIRAGGPFKHERDGVVFGNRERILPAKPRGHYHEYTVRTPGERSRGARRIVCGGAKAAPDTCYYTADHYQSFARIRE
jgi:ribonuclease T1